MDEGPDASAGVAEPTESEIARLAAERARLEAEVGILLLALAVGALELVVGRIGQLEPPSEPPPGNPAVEAR
jgi:hypothetical protein